MIGNGFGVEKSHVFRYRMEHTVEWELLDSDEFLSETSSKFRDDAMASRRIYTAF